MAGTPAPALAPEHMRCANLKPLPWQGYPIRPESALAVSTITFTGNTVFSSDRLLQSLISKEYHWYRLLSKDYVSFRGPFQSKALLELKGVVAQEDFGRGLAPCPPNEFGHFKDIASLGDFIRLGDFIVSGEYYYNSDTIPVEWALIELNYWRHGYLNPEIRVSLAADGPDVDSGSLTYAITEGDRYRFGAIKLTTDIKGYDVEDLRYAVDVAPGEWFDPVSVGDIESRLNNAKFGSGALFAALGKLPYGVKVCGAPWSFGGRIDKTIDLAFFVTLGRCPNQKSSAVVEAH